MAPTIAERAASGEALNVADLTHKERGQLLVWARAQNIGYKEIKQRFGFTQTTDTMRGWHMNLIRDQPPKVATFTDEDDRLLLHAVQLYATGPLNEKKSLQGVWKKAKEYIRDNGATTSAGERKLRDRWHMLRGQQDQASDTPAQPQVSLARSFTIYTGANQPTSSAQPAAGMEWEEEYPSLSEGERIEALGEGSHSADEEGWGEYSPLSEGERREVLGEDDSDKADGRAEDSNYSDKAEDGAEDSDEEENEKAPRPRPCKG